METKEDIFNSFYEDFLLKCESDLPVFIVDYKGEGNKGKGVSLNDFYSSSHWQTRHQLKKKVKPEMRRLIRDVLEYNYIKKFVLILEYNSRHDTDNVTGTEKLFVDALKKDKDGDGWVDDDSKKYFKFYGVKPVDDLGKNVFRFKIIDLTDGNKE